MDRPDDDIEQLLNQLDPATRTLFAEADLGQQAKEFANSQLGQHFIGSAMQEIAAAQEELETVWPWRRRRIQQLQNRIWRARWLLSWLRELLVGGKAAQSALEENE